MKRLDILLAFIVFLDLLGYGIIIPIIPSFQKIYNLSLDYMGLLISVFFFMNLVGCLTFGHLSDIFGRRKILLICLFGLAASYLLIALMQLFSHSFYLLLFLRALCGFFTGSTAVSFSSATNISKDKKELLKNLATLGISANLGFILGPSIGGFLGVNDNITLPFYVTSISIFFAFILTFFYFKDPENFQKYDNTDHRRFYIFKLLKGFLSNRNILIYMLMFMILATVTSCLELFLLTEKLNHELHFNSLQIGLIWTCFSFVVIFIELFIIKYFHTQKALIFAFLLLSFGTFLLNFSGDSIIFLVLILMIIGSATGLIYPNLNTHFSLEGDKTLQGLLFGINFSSDSIGGMIFPYTLSYIFLLTNNLHIIWIFLASFCFLGALIAKKTLIDKSTKKI